jgi:hypothetical protein
LRATLPWWQSAIPERWQDETLAAPEGALHSRRARRHCVPSRRESNRCPMGSLSSRQAIPAPSGAWYAIPFGTARLAVARMPEGNTTTVCAREHAFSRPLALLQGDRTFARDLFKISVMSRAYCAVAKLDRKSFMSGHSGGLTLILLEYAPRKDFIYP